MAVSSRNLEDTYEQRVATKCVSIVVPLCNAEQYITECIESALAQTHENIEVIVVDDGSTDNGKKVVLDIQSKDGRVKLICQKKNSGPSVARNVGLDSAIGDYVLFLDSDDCLESHTVELCLRALDAHGVDAVFFRAQAFCDGVTEELAEQFVYERPSFSDHKCIPGGTFFVSSIKERKYLASACLYLFRREVVRERFYPGILHEDNLFTTQFLVHTPGLLVTSIPMRLYRRRLRPGSIMTQQKTIRHVEGYLKVAEQLSKSPVLLQQDELSGAVASFAQEMLISAVRTAQAGKCWLDLKTRGRVLAVLSKLPFRWVSLKGLAAAVLPELFVVKDALKSLDEMTRSRV